MRKLRKKPMFWLAYVLLLNVITISCLLISTVKAAMPFAVLSAVGCLSGMYYLLPDDPKAKTKPNTEP